MTPSTPSGSPFISRFQGLSLQDAYHKLDAEIDQLQERLCSLRTFRNTLPPISQIPTEVLSRIFFHSQKDNTPAFPDDVDVKTRFFVSWVCRHWRSTALATPGLWTAISKKSRDVSIQVDFARELLLRSRNLGLAINLCKPSLDVLKVCLSELPRIQHLRLQSASYDREASSLLSKPAPQLTSLHLGRFSDSAPLFSAIYPSLSHLKISDSPSVMSSPLITPTITSLHIVNTIHYTLSAPVLIRVLTSLPNLTEFALVGRFDRTPIVASTHRLSHPRLQALSITGSSADKMFDFLGCLDIPKAAITVLSRADKDEDYIDIEHVGVAFDNYRRRIPFHIHHLGIRAGYDDLSIDISSAPLRHRHTINFQSGSPYEHASEFCPALSIMKLKTFSANYAADDPFERFEESTNLRTMTLSDLGTVSHAAWGLDNNIETGKTDFPCPALEEIRIHDSANCPKISEDLEELRKVLANRQAAGLGLPSLVFERCPGVDAAQFKEIVDVLTIIE